MAVAQSIVPGGMNWAMQQADTKTQKFDKALNKAKGNSSDVRQARRDKFIDMISTFGVDVKKNAGRPGVFSQRVNEMNNKIQGWKNLLGDAK
jgi:hypothetical protein